MAAVDDIPDPNPRLTPLAEFFARYPTFDYNPLGQCNSEFRRMCLFFSWGRKNKDRKTAKNLFHDALTKQFNQTFGNNLPSWHMLYEMLGIDPPNTVHACEQGLKNVNVNIIDLIENPGERVQTFDTEEALSAYSREEGKVFPREAAKAGNVLKHLLRHIGYEAVTMRRRRRNRRRRRGRRN